MFSSFIYIGTTKGFPGGSDGKESACNAGRFHLWIRKIPWRGKWQPTPVFLPGKCCGQRSLVGYCSWDGKKSDTTEQLTLAVCQALLWAPQEGDEPLPHDDSVFWKDNVKVSQWRRVRTERVWICWDWSAFLPPKYYLRYLCFQFCSGISVTSCVGHPDSPHTLELKRKSF